MSLNIVQFSNKLFTGQWPQASSSYHNCQHSEPVPSKQFVVFVAYTPCLKKTVQNCFCHNFVKFPPTLIMFGTLIAERINLYDVQLFFTSLN